ncbi:MAG: beta-ketoacyl synthase [Gammaproteobacteria bacterium]|nr:beta-ketoacyl synthase [Gammaproteobacteria bacterium]
MHHAYRRMVLESLPEQARAETITALAVLMNLVEGNSSGYHDNAGNSIKFGDIAQHFGVAVNEGTLVRRLRRNERIHNVNQSVRIDASSDKPLTLRLHRNDVPDPLPSGWKVSGDGSATVEIELSSAIDCQLASTRTVAAQAAGQLPDGFDPGSLYASRFHPRGLQMAIVAVSDALRMIGIPWETVRTTVRPEQIAVYASSSMSQMDEYGNGGLLQARLRGKRVSAKQLPMGFNSMPADFINAYVLGNVGHTSAITGACATFLYNLDAAVRAIRAGQCRVAVVGNAEAPLVPEIIDGYSTMNALATDADLCRLDNTTTPDYRRACRPFGHNCGFTLGESAQFCVLFDDALALELGAEIYGAIPYVFVNADGYKKSISAPGVGNYLTMARAVASAARLCGDDAVQHHSFVQAHGSSTPLNRVTESRIFDRVAATFGISSWPVTAVKAYVGHSLGPASADQLVSTLGTFAYGLLPGIKTIEHVAEDVHTSHVSIANKDRELESPAIGFINSKGFGGNNASAAVLGPELTRRLLGRRHGTRVLSAYRARNEQVLGLRDSLEAQAMQANPAPVYHFGEDLIDEDLIQITREGIRLPGDGGTVALDTPDDFADLGN